MTATAQTLPSGSSATASYDAQTGVLNLGIPAGATGAKGDKGDTGPKGDDYTLTSADKAEIAQLVLEEFPIAEEVEF